MPEPVQTIFDNLRSLGPRKLGLMAGIAALVMAVVVVGAMYLNKPAYETLYVGLERADVNQIGLVLGEAGIRFDVNSDGTAVEVPTGHTAQARMLLAEKGLPSSANAGYELFDNVGAMGLTTFMQQVTRVRALEGEIARTIQTINGIKAARVHIVLPERASFRQKEQQPSASVVIRTTDVDGARTASAIRHLVAAAVPGLGAEKVTVLDTSGTLLADGEDPSNNTAQRSIGVAQTVESQVTDNIRHALAPYLGAENFRASVMADVNTDTRQVEETTYDPDSRVERSVQTVRSSDDSDQQTAASPTTVTQNLPEEENVASAGPTSSQKSERREETTNYEISSKHVATTSNGYQIERLSVAVVVNRARLAEILGPNATPEQFDARIAEIRTVVASATGFSEKRGDVIDVQAVEFVGGLETIEAERPGVMDWLSRHAGTLINAGAFVLVVFLVTFFGLRPMTAALTRRDGADAEAEGAGRAALPGAAVAGQLPPAQGEAAIAEAIGADADLRMKIRPAPQERLARMVDLNEERTANILRKWAHPEAEAV